MSRPFRTAPMKDGIRYDSKGRPMTDPTSVAAEEAPPDESLERLAAALCLDARAEGYDHGVDPTLVSFQPPYCPRHLGIAQSVRYSLSRNFIEPSVARSRPAGELDVLRAALTTIVEWQTHGPLRERDADAMVAIARAALASSTTTEAGEPDHPFKDEWSFQRSMSGGNSMAGQPIAPDQPCFTCDVPFKDHRAAVRPVEREDAPDATALGAVGGHLRGVAE